MSQGTTGIVFGTFAPLHQGHLDLIYRAKKECQNGCIVVVCGFDGDKGEPLLPYRKRLNHVKEFFAQDQLVEVIGINDTQIGAARYPNGWERWMQEFNELYFAHTYDNSLKNRVWYVGDKQYQEDLTNMWNEKVVLVDRLSDNPISGTMIRNQPLKYWDKIAYTFRRDFSYNVLVCGTASEGKTTLVQDLAKYFGTSHSVEYARDYMKQLNLTDENLKREDFESFLTGQYALNKYNIKRAQNRGVFFADTDSMVTRMYAEYYAKDPNLNLSEEEFIEIAKLADDITSTCGWDKIYLLCPKGEFVDDGVRYMGHADMEDRTSLYNILCRNIKDAGLWDKVTILDKGYYGNFQHIVKEIREVLEK